MNVLSGGHPRRPGFAGDPDGIVGAPRRRAGGNQEIRCPSCSRLLVLRSGPAITSHFAHRPRQSCRNRPGRSVIPLRLEQLTLFELEPLAFPAAAAPLARFEAGDPLGHPTAGFRPEERAPTPPPHPPRRRRRRAWLPRLIRWLRARPG